MLLRHALAREFPGVIVLEHTDPEAALEALRVQTVDAIVTDNRMPKVSGVEFVRRLRAMNSTTPVVMLTGSDENRSEAYAAGVTTFIASGSWIEIRQRIRRTLEEGGMHGRPPSFPARQ